jgi:hypothetical protein
MDRRSFVQTVGGGIIGTLAPVERAAAAMQQNPAAGRLVTIDAKPAPLTIDTAKTAVIVVDMQNDFGAEGGMFHRAGIDTSMIRCGRADGKSASSDTRRWHQSRLSQDGVSGGPL